MEATLLSTIPSIELAEMTGEELEVLLIRLSDLTHKMQAQAASWLDAREQLMYVPVFFNS